MQTKPLSPVVVAALALGPICYACSSSSNGGQGQDGGLSDGTAPDVAQHPDSGAGACPTPVELTNFTPPPYAHARHTPGACSASDISGFDAACVAVGTMSEASCTSFEGTHTPCFSCLDSLRTSRTWGVFVGLPPPSINAELNIAGCIELTNPSDATCPQAIEASSACAHAACDPVCPATDGPSLVAWQTCASRAWATPACFSYWKAAQQCEMGSAGPSAACTKTYPSLDAALEAFAPIFCGGGDAGAMSSDASTD